MKHRYIKEENIRLLSALLESVEDSYPTFVDSIITGCYYDYKKYDRICEYLISFLLENPDADSNVILDKYMEVIGLPYRDKKDRWCWRGLLISEEDAKSIFQKYEDDLKCRLTNDPNFAPFWYTNIKKAQTQKSKRGHFYDNTGSEDHLG